MQQKGRHPHLTSSLFRADDAPIELPSAPISPEIPKLLISGDFTASRPRLSRILHCSTKLPQARMKKISLANFAFGSNLSARAEFVRFQKGEPNGLESTKNRRSVGGHGNQHVCVRRPQVTSGNNPTLSAGGRPGTTRSRSGRRVLAGAHLQDVLELKFWTSIMIELQGLSSKTSEP